jgi:hypothetical protein
VGLSSTFRTVGQRIADYRIKIDFSSMIISSFTKTVSKNSACMRIVIPEVKTIDPNINRNKAEFSKMSRVRMFTM